MLAVSAFESVASISQYAEEREACTLFSAFSREAVMASFKAFWLHLLYLSDKALRLSGIKVHDSLTGE